MALNEFRRCVYSPAPVALHTRIRNLVVSAGARCVSTTRLLFPTSVFGYVVTCVVGLALFGTSIWSSLRRLCAGVYRPVGKAKTTGFTEVEQINAYVPEVSQWKLEALCLIYFFVGEGLLGVRAGGGGEVHVVSIGT